MTAALILEIPLPERFSFKECLWFLNRNYDDCMHRLSEEAITKAIEIDHQTFLIHIRENNQLLEIHILQGIPSPEEQRSLISYVENWFDFCNDPMELYSLLLKDDRLAYMAEAYYGLRLVSIPNLFEALCWGIIGQQINLTFAYKLKRKLVERYGKKIDHENQSYYLFPSSAELLKASITELREMQFSQKKAEYLIGLARIFEAGEISEARLKVMPLLKDRQKALTDIRGIGIWTANYALMKAFREPSCIPYGDAGLLNALLKHEIIQQKGDAKAINAFFEHYQGWESYLVFYLWRSLS